jgi:hypothetical protein
MRRTQQSKKALLRGVPNQSKAARQRAQLFITYASGRGWDYRGYRFTGKSHGHLIFEKDEKTLPVFFAFSKTEPRGLTNGLKQFANMMIRKEAE